MNARDAVAAFKALGDPTRLSIVKFLSERCCAVVRAEDEEESAGPTVGDVCCSVIGGPKVTSTMSFHLKELRNAGLITMERRGKNIVCAMDLEAVEKLDSFLRSLIGGGAAKGESNVE